MPVTTRQVAWSHPQTDDCLQPGCILQSLSKACWAEARCVHRRSSRVGIVFMRSPLAEKGALILIAGPPPRPLSTSQRRR